MVAALSIPGLRDRTPVVSGMNPRATLRRLLLLLLTWSVLVTATQAQESTNNPFPNGSIEDLISNDPAFAAPTGAAPETATEAEEAGDGETAAVFEGTVIPRSRTGAPEPVEVRFRMSPEDAAEGDTVTLAITLAVEPGWHTFGLKEGPDQIGLPTLIEIDAAHNLRLKGKLTPDSEPELYKGTDLAHFGEVTWTQQFTVTGDGGYGVLGSIRYSICDANTCKPPKKVPFELGVVPEDASVGPGAISVQEASDSDPAGAESVEISEFKLLEAAPPANLAMNLVFAFLGGLILNVMPCVLPVIAIKVLSFVQQAGESRGRILALNGVYSLGVISVFLTLAALAVFLGKGWGSLFQDDYFNLFMAAVVFAMGLSLLGVFEIPVPGMVGSAGGVAHKEGLTGAFLTGIFATLLATPCTGPFMGTTLAWSLDQPTGTVFLIWGVMGLGMASPYLVLGAFPRLVHWLPQPGMWMVRFKEFAGFVLMGAVIWILTFINRDLIVPTLVMLAGISLGLWMIGNLYDHSTSRQTKWTVRAAALVLTVSICGFGYWMQAASTHLPWQEFSTAKVEELREEGKPILIDFTADWCNICKTNEALALNRRATISFVEEHDIVPLMADYTHLDPEITAWLDAANQEGVPLTLIFPAGRPNEAIPLRGPYSQGTLLQKLQQAVSMESEDSGKSNVADNEDSASNQARQPASAAGVGVVR